MIEQDQTPEKTCASDTADRLDRRDALKKIGALAGSAPAVSLLLTPSSARARGFGGSPCEDDRHRNCHGNGHCGDRPGNGHGHGHGWGHGHGNGAPGGGWNNGGGNGWGKGHGKGWGKGGSKGDKPRGRAL